MNMLENEINDPEARATKLKLAMYYLGDLGRILHRTSTEKGWWTDRDELSKTPAGKVQVDIGCIALVVTELSEAQKTMNSTTDNQQPSDPPVSSTRLLGAKPCPFCGSTRIVKGERYFAMCVDCGATGPERNADATERKFVGDWNTRNGASV